MFIKKKVFLTILRYVVKLKLQKARREISKRDDLITTNDYLYIISEILVYLIFPNPFIQGNFFLRKQIIFKYFNKEKYMGMRMFVDDTWMNYEINHLLEIFMIFRVIFMFRMGLYYTIFMAPRAYRLWFFS